MSVALEHERLPAATPAAGSTPGRSPVRARGLRLLALRIGFGVGCVALWWLVDAAGFVSPIVMRSPTEVGNALVDLVGGPVFWSALYSTVEATLIALTLASVVGIFLGVMIGLAPRIEAIVDPYLNAANATPRLAFAPVFIVAFGIGQSAKVALAFSLVVFILIINARAGIKVIDQDIVKLGTVMGLSRIQLLRKVLLPSAVPSIFAGLRLAVIYSLLGVVGSELIASRAGMGQLIASYTATFDLAKVYALVLVLALLGGVLNMATEKSERRLLRWQTPD